MAESNLHRRDQCGEPFCGSRERSSGWRCSTTNPRPRRRVLLHFVRILCPSPMARFLRPNWLLFPCQEHLRTRWQVLGFLCACAWWNPTGLWAEQKTPFYESVIERPRPRWLCQTEANCTWDPGPRIAKKCNSASASSVLSKVSRPVFCAFCLQASFRRNSCCSRRQGMAIAPVWTCSAAIAFSNDDCESIMTVILIALSSGEGNLVIQPPNSNFGKPPLNGLCLNQSMAMNLRVPLQNQRQRQRRAADEVHENSGHRRSQKLVPQLQELHVQMSGTKSQTTYLMA